MKKETIYRSMYPSPEQCRELRNLGFDQTLAPAYWVWLETGCWGGWALELTHDGMQPATVLYAEPGAREIMRQHPNDADRYLTQSCCAYDLQALMGLLGDFLLDFDSDPDQPGHIMFPYNRASLPYACLVEGCADLLIYLVRHEFISAAECNERLIPYRKGDNS